MNYFTDFYNELKNAMPMPCEHELLVSYTLLGLTKGVNVTLEDVHDAWSSWRAFSDRPDHKSLVPFDELSPEVQDMDKPFQDAIIATYIKLRG